MCVINYQSKTNSLPFEMVGTLANKVLLDGVICGEFSWSSSWLSYDAIGFVSNDDLIPLELWF